MIAKSLLALLNQTAPLLRCIYEEWTYRQRLKDNTSAPLTDDEKTYLALSIDDLKDSHRSALSLREQLQRRAQGYLMAITVASSFSLGAIALLTRARQDGHGIALPPVTKVILVAIVASFLMSAISALRILSPSSIYDFWLRNQIPVGEEQKKANLIRFIKLNEAFAIIYAIHARSSYVSMRNGAILLFLSLIAFIVAPSVF